MSPRPSRGRPQLTRRLTWGVVDQALSSATNLVATVAAARLLDPVAFGAFSVAFLATQLGIGGLRAVTAEPLVARHAAAAAPEARRDAARGATSVALLIGLAALPVLAALGLVIGGDTGAVLVVLAPLLPLALVQDVVRYVHIAQGSPARAAANDALWGAGLLAALALVHLTGTTGVAAITACWLVPAAVAGLVGLVDLRVVPGWRAAHGWAVRHADLGGRYLVEFAAFAAAPQAALLVLAPRIGVEALGSLRGAQTLMGPLTMLFFGLFAPAVAEGSRLIDREPQRFRRIHTVLTLGMAAAAVAWTALLLATPDSIGRQVLGDTWTDASALLLPYGLAMVGTALWLSAFAGLRALAAATTTMPVRLVISPVVFAGTLAGGLIAGAWGVAVAMAVLNLAEAAVWWGTFRVLVRRRTTAAPASP